MAYSKIHKDNAYVSKAESHIASNSLVLAPWTFVQISWGYVVKAGTTGKVDGLCQATQTFASDNQTVAKDKVVYVPVRKGLLFECPITGGTVTIADEGVSFYNLYSDSIQIDGSTEKTYEAMIDTTSAAAEDAVVFKQFKLVKFISSTKGIFEAVC